MKKPFTFFLLFFTVLFSGVSFAQLKISGSANLVISSGSTVVAEDIVNNGGSITNNGTLEIKGTVENNTTDLTASSSSGTIKFNGTSAQQITGDHDANLYGSVEINNSAGVSLTNTATGSDLTIHGTLALTNGIFTLNGFNLSATSVSGGSASAYIKTNGSGVLKMEVGNSDVSFPVGNSNFNPITLNNAGTSDTYGVRVLDHEPAGASTQHMVDRSWEVTETTAGGSDLTVTTQWNSGEELTGFDRSSSQVGLTTDNGSTYQWATVGAASGSDPYVRNGSGFSGVGTFTVGDYFYGGLNLNMKLFLAGTYNTSNHIMDKTLYDNNLAYHRPVWNQ
jgi:hypothetical protein